MPKEKLAKRNYLVLNKVWTHNPTITKKLQSQFNQITIVIIP